MTKLLAAIYLLAIVCANLLAATFGPAITILNAFLFIGLDLTSRDFLHERWTKIQLFSLILAGGILSYWLNSGAGLIAVASTVAFVSAAMVDTIIYWIFRKYSRLLKINISNIGGAATDSLIFPTLAFGTIMPAIVLGQFLAKVGGGFIWSLILVVFIRKGGSRFTSDASTRNGELTA